MLNVVHFTCRNSNLEPLCSLWACLCALRLS